MDKEEKIMSFREVVSELVRDEKDTLVSTGTTVKGMMKLQRATHKNAKEKGFYDKPRETGTLLALIHSEVSEALEADRKKDFLGFAEELADIVIRVMDLAELKGINLGLEVMDKMIKNEKRERMHGKEY